MTLGIFIRHDSDMKLRKDLRNPKLKVLNVANFHFKYSPRHSEPLFTVESYFFPNST